MYIYMYVYDHTTSTFECKITEEENRKISIVPADINYLPRTSH